MKVSFDTKTEAAQFVSDLRTAFPSVSLSITITPQGRYEVCFASPAIDTPLDVIGEELIASGFFATQSNT